MSREAKELYWKQLCQKHYLVKHENIEQGTDDEINIRRSFVALSEEDGLDSALSNWINFPVVVMIGKTQYKPVDRKGSARKSYFNKLFFLDKIAQTSGEVTEAPSVQRAFDRAQQVMEDFVSDVQETYEELGGCGPFKYFELSECIMTEVENIAGGLRGWTLEFTDEESAANLLSKDETHWDGIPVSSTGGSSGSIPTDNSDNVGEIDTAPTGRHYSVHLHNVRSTTMSFYIDKQATIDWGDGTPLKKYPGDHTINHTYNDIGDDPIEIKVYWEVNAPNICRVLYVNSGGSTPNTAIVDSIDGDTPSNMWRFQVSNGLSDFPFALVPSSVKYINLQRCSFSAVQLNAIMQMFKDRNISNGTLRLNLQNPPAPDIDMNLVEDLRNLGNKIDFDI